MINQKGQSCAAQRSVQEEVSVIGGQYTFDIHVNETIRTVESPALQRTCFSPTVADASMAAQVARFMRLRSLHEVSGRADNGHAQIRREPDRYHVLMHEFARPDAGIEACGDNVSNAVIDDQVEPDTRVRCEEVGQNRRHDELRSDSWQIHTHNARWPVMARTRIMDGLFHFKERRPQALEQYLPRFGRCDATRRPVEQPYA